MITAHSPFLLIAQVTAFANDAEIDSTWTIVVWQMSRPGVVKEAGLMIDSMEKIAADGLKDFYRTELGVTLGGPVAAQGFSGQKAIFIGTIENTPQIAAQNTATHLILMRMRL